MFAITTAWACPHCGTINKNYRQDVAQHGGIELAYCDVEQGGCDRPLAIATHISIETKAHEINGL